MSYESFQVLLARVRPIIEKKDTWMRKAIPAGERLVITLRYLGSGKQYSCHYLSLYLLSALRDNLPQGAITEKIIIVSMKNP